MAASITDGHELTGMPARHSFLNCRPASRLDLRAVDPVFVETVMEARQMLGRRRRKIRLRKPVSHSQAMDSLPDC